MCKRQKKRKLQKNSKKAKYFDEDFFIENIFNAIWQDRPKIRCRKPDKDVIFQIRNAIFTTQILMRKYFQHFFRFTFHKETYESDLKSIWLHWVNSVRENVNEKIIDAFAIIAEAVLFFYTESNFQFEKSDVKSMLSEWLKDELKNVKLRTRQNWIDFALHCSESYKTLIEFFKRTEVIPLEYSGKKLNNLNFFRNSEKQQQYSVDLLEKMRTSPVVFPVPEDIKDVVKYTDHTTKFVCVRLKSEIEEHQKFNKFMEKIENKNYSRISSSSTDLINISSDISPATNPAKGIIELKNSHDSRFNDLVQKVIQDQQNCIRRRQNENDSKTSSSTTDLTNMSSNISPITDNVEKTIPSSVTDITKKNITSNTSQITAQYNKLLTGTVSVGTSVVGDSNKNKNLPEKEFIDTDNLPPEKRYKFDKSLPYHFPLPCVKEDLDEDILGYIPAFAETNQINNESISMELQKPCSIKEEYIPTKINKKKFISTDNSRCWTKNLIEQNVIKPPINDLNNPMVKSKNNLSIEQARDYMKNISKYQPTIPTQENNECSSEPTQEENKSSSEPIQEKNNECSSEPTQGEINECSSEPTQEENNECASEPTQEENNECSSELGEEDTLGNKIEVTDFCKSFNAKVLGHGAPVRSYCHLISSKYNNSVAMLQKLLYYENNPIKSINYETGQISDHSKFTDFKEINLVHSEFSCYLLGKQRVEN